MPEASFFAVLSFGLVLFGMIMLYSASYATTGPSYFAKQLVWTGVGLMGFFGVFVIGYKRLSDWSPVLCALSVIALGATLCFPEVNGARRWIRFGPISIQPSEFVKVVLVLFMARFLSTRTQDIELRPFRRVILPTACVCGLMIALVLAGEDLGTTSLLCALYMILLFAAGISLWWLIPAGIGFPLLAFLGVYHFSPVRMARLTSFLNPEPVQETTGYQLWHSLLALGSGSWTGVGFTESRLKFKYLPEAHTDFILSIVGEELGFVSLLCLMAAYLVLGVVALFICMKARTRQGMLLSFGMIVFILLQALINIGVVCGGFPTKGMPAPMISYGGSSLIACMIACGVIFSVAYDTEHPDYSDQWIPAIRTRWEQLRAKWFGGGSQTP